jgi:hypothetical protein
MKNYFQFPLCLLTYGKHERERMSAIIDYSIVNYSKKKLGSTKRDAIDTAAEVLCVNYQNTPLSHIVEQWKEVSEFVERFESRHGKDARVRIASSLLWDSYKGGLAYREFSVLCALNSILGKTTSPKRVTQPSLRVRAAGYKSWNVAIAEAATERLLSEDQIKRTLNRLDRRGFFARARIGGRTVLFKTGVSYEELCNEIEERETGKRLNRSAKDRQLRFRLKAADSGVDINRPAHINRDDSDRQNRQNLSKTRRLTADCCADESADEPADINKSSLIEAFNKSSPNKSVRNSACAHDLSFFQKDGNLPETRIHTKLPEAILEVKEVRYKLKGGTKIFSQQEANRLFAGNNALEFERL